MPQTMQGLLNDMVHELRPIVAHIEGLPAITQDRYDAYLGAISRLSGTTKGQMLAAIALVMAGANKQGVMGALRALGHEVD